VGRHMGGRGWVHLEPLEGPQSSPAAQSKKRRPERTLHPCPCHGENGKSDVRSLIEGKPSMGSHTDPVGGWGEERGLEKKLQAKQMSLKRN